MPGSGCEAVKADQNPLVRRSTRSSVLRVSAPSWSTYTKGLRLIAVKRPWPLLAVEARRGDALVRAVLQKGSVGDRLARLHNIRYKSGRLV